jgi:hypothetical protein
MGRNQGLALYTKKFKKNKVLVTDTLMPRILILTLMYTSDLHITSLTFNSLFNYGAKVCIPAWKQSLSSACSQEVAACLMLASVANALPASCFLRGS